MSRRRAPVGHEEAQDYMITVGDLMAGLIFLFILTLMIFAFRFQTATAAIQSAVETRTYILQQLRDRLEVEGMSVTIDTLQGVLRLSEADEMIGFPVGSEIIIQEHLPRVQTLTTVLAEVVPCFTAGSELPCGIESLDAERFASRIHALQIEGHTDTIPFAEDTRSRFTGNLELSAARAAHVFELVTSFEPGMATLLNLDSVPVLGVAGYGKQRRLPGLPGDDDRLRRIDLRFLMEPPRATTLVPVRVTEDRIRTQREQ